MKSPLTRLPLIYLFILAILTSYSPPFTFNPIFLLIAIALGFQIYFNNQKINFVLGSIVLVGNILFFLALVSEASEFPTNNNQALQLIGVGFTIFILNFIAGILLVRAFILEKSLVNPINQ